MSSTDLSFAAVEPPSNPLNKNFKGVIMKTTALIFCLFGLSLSAQASSFYYTCSDADQTVKIAEGHASPSVTVTEATYINGTVKTPVKLQYGEYQIEYSDAKELHREQSNSCDNSDREAGVYRVLNVSYAKVKISKRDGSSFSENTMGVTLDGKSVEAFVICEKEITGMLPCPTK